MLRFYVTEWIRNRGIRINGRTLLMGNDVWKDCRDILREGDDGPKDTVNVIPIRNGEGELVAYGYQDWEANRELRMLAELREHRHALQFGDIFPEYRGVILCGCNELAVAFAEYLRELGITVSVEGKHWEYFGYESIDGADLDCIGKLVIYAEGHVPMNGDLLQNVKRSVSPEFECIDRLYEENVLRGIIQDTQGGFQELLRKLEKETEILILGDDREAQDVWDLLLEHGIEIYGFAVEGKGGDNLLGKKRVGIADAVKRFCRPVFLNYKDCHGALGEKWTEYFDYLGYKRNRQYFLLRDYTDIPVSNLVHVLHAKRVLLAGDWQLCRLLTEYLYDVEEGRITISYMDLTRDVPEGETDMMCLVIPDYHTGIREEEKEKREMLKRRSADKGFCGYTEYFVDSGRFALIDLWLNRRSRKYSVPELVPKGILLGRIPGWSGNFFFRGIMDGHPEILMIPSFYDFNNNLFYYCIRLAHMASGDILPEFFRMYGEEACEKEKDFPYPERFESSVRRRLQEEKKYTSQELFVLFHIAYAEMLSGKQITDIHGLVIYWEPHLLSRNVFPFLALWLEEAGIGGWTIVLRRNNIVRTGSACSRKPDNMDSVLDVMFLDESVYDGVQLQLHHWTEFKMRFEDIKLRPKEKLTMICRQLGIGWSDSMLQTTSAGRPLSYRGSVDFDLKTAFNKYEDFLSEFDRFRISIASAPYQRRYGFSHENILDFTRNELQEFFLKPFLFEKNGLFEITEQEYVKIYERIRWRLWNVRKQMVCSDVQAEFDRFELWQTAEERMEEYRQWECARTLEYAKTHEKLVLYGTGTDCRGLLGCMDESIKHRILYSDKKARTKPYVFQGKTVMAPKTLCGIYKDYHILVTSSRYCREIERELDAMGIDPSRVFYNKAEFGRYTQ